MELVILNNTKESKDYKSLSSENSLLPTNKVTSHKGVLYSHTYLYLFSYGNYFFLGWKLLLLGSKEYCFIWLRDLDTKKIETQIFDELWNVVLEENGEDKIVRESN